MSEPHLFPRDPPGRRRRAGVLPALAATLLATVAAAPADGEARILHVLIDREGLPALHETQEDGPSVMHLPQFRLFDAEGRPLWSFSGLPRGFQRELERRLTDPGRAPVEGRSFRQEARYFLRRGGLPLNLTTLPATDVTIVEYWTGGCRVSKKLAREVDKFFARRPETSVKIVRVLIDLG